MEMTEKNRKYGSFIYVGRIIVGVSILVLFLVLSSCAMPAKNVTDYSDAELKICLTGNDFSAWRKKTGDWQVVGDAVMCSEDERRLTVRSGSGVIVNGPKGNTENLISRAKFGDVMAHIEFMVPRKSNSGVYFMGKYEIQIFDSYGKKTRTGR